MLFCSLYFLAQSLRADCCILFGGLRYFTQHDLHGLLIFPLTYQKSISDLKALHLVHKTGRPVLRLRSTLTLRREIEPEETGRYVLGLVIDRKPKIVLCDTERIGKIYLFPTRYKQAMVPPIR